MPVVKNKKQAKINVESLIAAQTKALGATTDAATARIIKDNLLAYLETNKEIFEGDVGEQNAKITTAYANSPAVKKTAAAGVAFLDNSSPGSSSMSSASNAPAAPPPPPATTSPTGSRSTTPPGNKRFSPSKGDPNFSTDLKNALNSPFKLKPLSKSMPTTPEKTPANFWGDEKEWKGKGKEGLSADTGVSSIGLGERRTFKTPETLIVRQAELIKIPIKTVDSFLGPPKKLVLCSSSELESFTPLSTPPSTKVATPTSSKKTPPPIVHPRAKLSPTVGGPSSPAKLIPPNSPKGALTSGSSSSEFLSIPKAPPQPLVRTPPGNEKANGPAAVKPQIARKPSKTS